MPIKIDYSGRHKLFGPDGTLISQHTDRKEAHERASSQPNGKYRLEMADEIITVTGNGAPAPAPQPPLVALAVASQQTDGTLVVSTVGTAPAGTATLASWLLTWGDGKSDSDIGGPPSSLTHKYDGGGNYSVKLTVQDSNAMTNSASLSASIVVNPPTPIPNPVPVPPPPPPVTPRQFVGGWRLAFSFEPQGSLAINFSTMQAYIGTAGGIRVFNLPAMGGPDINTWPRVSSVSTIADWWPGSQAGAQSVYSNGLILWQNKLWVAPRGFYTVDPAASLPLTIYAQDGATMTFAGLTQQKFSGFVKRGPGLDPLIGGGGYESGQGSQSGPSLAELNGMKRIEYQWPGLPGPNDANGVPVNWNLRAPRDTNYYPSDHGDPNRTDYWVAWNPRTINGVLEGRWPSDYIFAGGLVLPEGITYWAWQGKGALDYANQNPTFASSGQTQVSQYRYNATTYAFEAFAILSEPGRFPVKGQELGPDGSVYLSVINRWWDTGQNMVDVAILVYR